MTAATKTYADVEPGDRLHLGGGPIRSRTVKSVSEPYLRGGRWHHIYVVAIEFTDGYAVEVAAGWEAR